MTIDILWQDAYALAVNKPSGLLVHNSRYAGPRERSLRQMLGEQLGKPLYPIHRLDRPTSGVVLFVTDRAAARPWHEQLALDATEKTYLALVRGHLAEAQTIDHALGEGGTQRPALSRVTPLLHSPRERCSLVAVRLHTGRRHQARRHLAHISHPIVGDTTHGKGAINRHYRARYGLWRLALHAWRLHLDHPFTGERLHIQAPLPLDLEQVWAQLFPRESLDALLSALA